MPILPAVLNAFTTTNCGDFTYAYLAEDTMTSFTDTTRTSEAQASASSRSTRQSESSAAQSKLGNSTTPFLEKFYRGITNPIRLLPDFLIIGTQRGGTTSLFHYLEEHPCIQPAVNKDLHFFDRKYNKGLAWYRGHFPTRIEQYYAQRMRGRAFLTGEASPSYLFHPYA